MAKPATFPSSPTESVVGADLEMRDYSRRAANAALAGVLLGSKTLRV